MKLEKAYTMTTQAIKLINALLKFLTGNCYYKPYRNHYSCSSRKSARQSHHGIALAGLSEKIWSSSSNI
jgi:hypothetical protein